ncbi:MAG: hypothetical protein C0616_08150 [Desulfuromonas sp.]|nr:MAG: hypothetical protein C0616_08150 [Desulfuromonas sp.]
MVEVTRIFNVVEFLRGRISKSMPIQHVALFLLVAQKQGITMPDLCEQLSMPQGSLSRNVKLLSRFLEKSNGRMVARGYDLLRTEPSTANPHALAVFLTPKGEDLVEEMVDMLEGVEIDAAVQQKSAAGSERIAEKSVNVVGRSQVC